MFDCPQAHFFTGPKESTCIEEGYWKPDPIQVKCIGKCLKRIYLNTFTELRGLNNAI